MKVRWVTMALGLALFVFASDPTLAGKRSVKVLDVSPLSTTSPVTPTNGLKVCLSGFSEGDWVSLTVPWVGSPDSHSDLKYAYYMDATGGRCFTCPPDWTEMDLQAGTYTINTEWSNGTGNGFHRGPTATFVVMGN